MPEIDVHDTHAGNQAQFTARRVEPVHSVAVVEACCKQAKPNGKPIELFLRDVTTVDQTGQILLSRLAAKGVRLVARGVYTSYLVQSLPSGKAPNDPPVEKHRRLS